MCKACPNLFFQWAPGAPFSKRRVCGVPSLSRGRDNLQPRPPAAAQPKFGSKNLRFFLLSQESPFDKCMCATTPEKHTGHLPSTNFNKKKRAILWFWKFLCKNWPNWGVSLGMSQHVAAACRSMSRRFLCASLGMSQHVAPLLASVAGHVAACRATFGRVATFRWGLGEFLAKISVLGLASAPPCFSDSPRAHKRPEVSVFFCQRGIGRKEGDFTFQRELNDLFGSGTVTPGPSCECDITFLLRGGQNLGNNCVTVR